MSSHKSCKFSLLNALPHIRKFCMLSHLLDSSKMAVELLQDEKTQTVFELKRYEASYAYLLLLDLLFKQKAYSQIMEIYNNLNLKLLPPDSHQTLSILTLVFLSIMQDGNSFQDQGFRL